MITRTFEAGWSDPDLNVSGSVYGDTDFGRIYVINEVFGDPSKPFAEIVVNYIPPDLSEFRFGFRVCVENNYSYSGYVYFDVYDPNGVKIETIKEFIAANGTRSVWVTPKISATGTYTVVPYRDNDYMNILYVDGVKFSGITDYGRRDYVNGIVRVYQEYYDATNSTTDYEHDITFWFMGIPAVKELVTKQHIAELTEYETDVVEEVLFPTIDEAGNNYHSDIDLIATMILNSNGFYNQTQYYNKAIAELIIGGEVMATIDLLTNDVGYTTSEFTISAGTYNDAKVKFTINPKQPDKFIRHLAQVSFNFKYSSDYESVTA